MNYNVGHSKFCDKIKWKLLARDSRKDIYSFNKYLSSAFCVPDAAHSCGESVRNLTDNYIDAMSCKGAFISTAFSKKAVHLEWGVGYKFEKRVVWKNDGDLN